MTPHAVRTSEKRTTSLQGTIKGPTLWTTSLPGTKSPPFMLRYLCVNIDYNYNIGNHQYSTGTTSATQQLYQRMHVDQGCGFSETINQDTMYMYCGPLISTRSKLEGK